jgi:hypothetical protein
VVALRAAPTRAPLAVRVVRARGGRAPPPDAAQQCASFVGATLVAGWGSQPREGALSAYATLLPARDAGVQAGAPACTPACARAHAAAQTPWRPKASVAVQADGVA